MGHSIIFFAIKRAFLNEDLNKIFVGDQAEDLNECIRALTHDLEIICT